jgi:hypothetical protein
MNELIKQIAKIEEGIEIGAYEGEEEEKAQCQPLTADFLTKRVTWILG